MFVVRPLHKSVILSGGARVVCELRSRRTPTVSSLPIQFEPFSRCGWGRVATVLVEKGEAASARQNVSGFFDCVTRKVRESLRSE